MSGIRQWFSKLKFNCVILFNSLFRGMKSADDKTLGVMKEGRAADNAIEEQIQEQGVLNDLLRGEVTQEVIELRDSNYRVYKHANDYDYLGNGNVVKKVKNMLVDDLKIYNPEEYKVVVIQDNKLVVKGVVEAAEAHNLDSDGDVAKDDTDERFTIKIERDVFPRFLLEKYVKKVVVRDSEDNNVKIDLYCSSYARQFNPTDSLFINEMMNIYGKKTRNLDTVDIMSLEFIADKAYNADDITLFRFESIVYEGMHMYDKDFVITYSAYPVCNGLDLTEKYKTKEMDEKYAVNAPKSDEKVISIEEFFYEKDTLNIDDALKLLKEVDTENFKNSAE